MSSFLKLLLSCLVIFCLFEKARKVTNTAFYPNHVQLQGASCFTSVPVNVGNRYILYERLLPLSSEAVGHPALLTHTA